MSMHLASKRGILAAKAKLPADVVFRSFASETVILNLNTSRYHGLNPTGGRMLEAMLASNTVDQAARLLAAEYERPFEQIADDLCGFSLALHERGLIELSDPQAT